MAEGEFQQHLIEIVLVVTAEYFRKASLITLLHMELVYKRKASAPKATEIKVRLRSSYKGCCDKHHHVQTGVLFKTETTIGALMSLTRAFPGVHYTFIKRLCF